MKRPRGRSQSNPMNRRGHGNISRNYESNGPDIKVRGTAPQIAEKYTQLWRDALSSGDMVGAENYLQHAEHYNRIVASFQPVQNQQPYQRSEEDRADDGEASENAEAGAQPEERDTSHRQERGNNNQNRYNNHHDSAPREHRNENRDYRGSRDNPRYDNPRYNGDNPRYSRDNRERDNRPDYRQPREQRPPQHMEDGVAVPQSAPAQEVRQPSADAHQNEQRQNNRPRYPREQGENRGSRQRLPRPRYNNQNDDADVGELPSFITGGSTSALPGNSSAAQTAPVPVTPVTPLSVVPDHSEPKAPTPVEEAAAAPAPRRRTTRTRVASDDAAEVAKEKPAPRRRAAPRKENIEAE